MTYLFTDKHKFVIDPDGVLIPKDPKNPDYQLFLQGKAAGHITTRRVYQQYSPTVVVSPEGQHIPIDLGNKDFREFQAGLEDKTHDVETTFDPKNYKP